MPENHWEEALTPELVATIRELQSLSGLHPFSVAGGTNLTLRFNHRKSIDVDLFSNQLVGVNGLSAIKSELESFYRTTVLACELVNAELGDQYCFLKALIKKETV